jgi:two-component sensor histidine kinase
MRTTLKLFLAITFICFTFLKAEEKSQDYQKLVYNIESLIVSGQNDSALLALNNLDTTNQYLNDLSTWLTKEKSNRILFQICKQLITVQDERQQYINEFIEKNIFVDQKDFQLYYINIRIIQHHILFELGKPSEADVLLKYIKNYLNKYKDQIPKEELLNIQFKLNKHDIIKASINNNAEEYKRLLDENISIQKQTNSKIQLINNIESSLHYYRLIQDINSFVTTAQEYINIHHKHDSTSIEYYDAHFFLIDVLIFRAETDKSIDLENRIFHLLKKINNSPYPHIKSKSMSYFIQYFIAYPITTNHAQEIFQLLGAEDLVGLINNYISSIKKGNNITYISQEYRIATRALLAHNYKDEAIKFLMENNELIKKKYSEDLAQNIAQIEIQKNKEKNKLTLQKEKYKQYIYLSIASVLVLISLLLIWFQQQQKKKNKLLAKKESEKTLLLKEIHHRVKNNFQIAIALMDLQFKDVKDQKTLYLLQEWKSKIKSMVMVHQNLYQNKNLKVPIKEYIKQIVKDITFAYSNVECETEIKSEINLNLDIDTAVNLGLILNELINNSFKYGVIDNKLKLSILLSEKNSVYQLYFSDHGKGFNTLENAGSPETFGLKLIHQLTKQMGGKVEMKNDHGAHFKINFKIKQNLS